MRIINEPTAAALAYGLDKGECPDYTGFDLGGGTLTYLYWKSGMGFLRVKATSGNNRLGGDDFDDKIINWLVTEFKKEHSVDLTNDKYGHAPAERSSRKGQTQDYPA